MGEAVGATVVMCMWTVMAVHVGGRQHRPGESRAVRVRTLALAMLVWPLMWLAEGGDPEGLRRNIDDDRI